MIQSAAVVQITLFICSCHWMQSLKRVIELLWVTHALQCPMYLEKRETCAATPTNTCLKVLCHVRSNNVSRCAFLFKVTLGVVFNVGLRQRSVSEIFYQNAVPVAAYYHPTLLLYIPYPADFIWARGGPVNTVTSSEWFSLTNLLSCSLDTVPASAISPVTVAAKTREWSSSSRSVSTTSAHPSSPSAPATKPHSIWATTTATIRSKHRAPSRISVD